MTDQPGRTPSWASTTGGVMKNALVGVVILAGCYASYYIGTVSGGG